MMRSHLVYALATAMLLPGPAGAQEDYVGVPPQADETEPIGPPPTRHDFEQELSPHGQWIDSPTHGRVWHPRVRRGWKPYYYGHWAWTSAGWFWVSDEPWGPTYHYGRWAYDPAYGWVWLPGYEWAPAWVTWRFGVDVVGWAPLAPGFSLFVAPAPGLFVSWTFVPAVKFAGFPVYRCAFAPAYAPRFFRATSPAPPRASFGAARSPVWGGPPHRLVEQRMGRAIPPARIGAPRSAFRGEVGPAHRGSGPGWRGSPHGRVAAPGGGYRGGPGTTSRGGGSDHGRAAPHGWTAPHRSAAPAGGYRGGPGTISRGGSDHGRAAPHGWTAPRGHAAPRSALRGPPPSGSRSPGHAPRRGDSGRGSHPGGRG